LPGAAPKGAMKSIGCAEAYMGTAELALSLPNGRSVEILVVPPPQAVAILAGGPTAPGRKSALSGRKLN
jgi:hypothetical protein